MKSTLLVLHLGDALIQVRQSTSRITRLKNIKPQVSHGFREVVFAPRSCSTVAPYLWLPDQWPYPDVSANLEITLRAIKPWRRYLSFWPSGRDNGVFWYWYVVPRARRLVSVSWHQSCSIQLPGQYVTNWGCLVLVTWRFDVVWTRWSLPVSLFCQTGDTDPGGLLPSLYVRSSASPAVSLFFPTLVSIPLSNPNGDAKLGGAWNVWCLPHGSSFLFCHPIGTSNGVLIPCLCDWVRGLRPAPTFRFPSSASYPASAQQDPPLPQIPRNNIVANGRRRSGANGDGASLMVIMERTWAQSS